MADLDEGRVALRGVLVPPPDIQDFVCLLGIDGSGKTTVLDALALEHPEVVVVDWSRVVAKYAPYLKPLAQLQTLGPHGRAGLLCLVASLEYDMVIAPALSQGRFVVVNSYWYKFTAQMRLLGIAAGFLLPACQSLPRPRKVVFLDTPPEVAAARPRTPTVFEYSGHPTDFVRFQRALRVEMLHLVGELPVEYLDGRLPLDAIIREFLALCAPAQEPRGDAAALGAGPRDDAMSR